MFDQTQPRRFEYDTYQISEVLKSLISAISEKEWIGNSRLKKISSHLTHQLGLILSLAMTIDGRTE